MLRDDFSERINRVIRGFAVFGTQDRGRKEGRGWRMCQMADFGDGNIEPPDRSTYHSGGEVTFKLLATIFHTQ